MIECRSPRGTDYRRQTPIPVGCCTDRGDGAMAVPTMARRGRAIAAVGWSSIPAEDTCGISITGGGETRCG